MRVKREKTAAETRRANRGNVPGHLGMAELAMLVGKPDTVTKRTCPSCGVSQHAACTLSGCPLARAR